MSVVCPGSHWLITPSRTPTPDVLASPRAVTEGPGPTRGCHLGSPGALPQHTDLPCRTDQVRLKRRLRSHRSGNWKSKTKPWAGAVPLSAVTEELFQASLPASGASGAPWSAAGGCLPCVLPWWGLSCPDRCIHLVLKPLVRLDGRPPRPTPP